MATEDTEGTEQILFEGAAGIGSVSSVSSVANLKLFFSS